jgi:DNA-binding CsgD family transcriptional regulator
MTYIDQIVIPIDPLLSPAGFPANWRQFLNALNAMVPECAIEAAWDCPWTSGSSFTLPPGAPPAALTGTGPEHGPDGDIITITADGTGNSRARLRLARCGASPERWEDLRRFLNTRMAQIREGLAAGRFALEAGASSDLATAMIEHCPRPTLLLGASGQVQLMNAEATRAVGENRGLTVGSDNRVRLHVRAENQKFAGLMEELLIRFATDARAAGAMRFHAPDLHEVHGLQMKVVAPPRALSTASPAVQLAGPWLIVTVHFHDMPARLASEMLAPALGLTPAEAQLVAALASGRSLQNYADAEGLKITTVRWHLRNVLRRTGMHSQTELVAFVLSMFS